MIHWAFLVAQMVKSLPAMQETRIQSLGQEDSLEKGMATNSSSLAWSIPWTEEPGWLQPMGSHRVRHDWATNTFTLWSISCTSGYIPQRIESKSQSAMHFANIHVNSSLIHISWNMEAVHVPINGWMDRQNVVYSHNGILFIKRGFWHKLQH